VQGYDEADLGVALELTTVALATEALSALDWLAVNDRRRRRHEAGRAAVPFIGCCRVRDSAHVCKRKGKRRSLLQFPPSRETYFLPLPHSVCRDSRLRFHCIVRCDV
jgi:hypothetical protein